MYPQFRQLVALSLALAGCSEVTSKGHQLSTDTRLELSADNHLYLRCQSSGWRIDSNNYMQPVTKENLRELTIIVDNSQMLGAGDECFLTASSKLLSWDEGYRNYGLASGRLQAPDSDWLKQWELPATEIPFRMVYSSLGQYRFTVDVKSGYASLRKDGAAITGGDIAWAAPGAYVKDDANHLFLQADKPFASLALMDQEQGLPKWVFQEKSGGIIFRPNCGDEQQLVLRHGNKVSAVAKASGDVIWQQQPQELINSHGNDISCLANSSIVLLSYGVDNTKLIALSKNDGTLLWTFSSNHQLSVFGSDETNVYFYVEDQNLSYMALDLVSGQQRWQKLVNSGRYELDDQQRLFHKEGRSISRINPQNGGYLWTFEGQSSLFYYTSTGGAGIVRDQNLIRRIDSENGAIIWSYDSHSDILGFPYITAAKLASQSIVVVRLAGDSRGETLYKFLDLATGRVEAEINLEDPAAFIVDVDRDSLLLQSGDLLQSFDLPSGELVWSYLFVPNSSGKVLYGLVDQSSDTIYLNYGYRGSSYPAMGLVAIDNKKGQEKWRQFYGKHLRVSHSSEDYLYVNFGEVIPSGAKAIIKH